MFLDSNIFRKLAYSGLISVLLTPLLFQLFQIDFDEIVLDDLINYSYPYIIGLVLLLPWLLLIFTGSFLISKFIQGFLFQKLLILVLNLMIIFSFFYLFSGNTLMYNLDLLILYLLISTMALYIFYRI